MSDQLSGLVFRLPFLMQHGVVWYAGRLATIVNIH